RAGISHATDLSPGSVALSPRHERWSGDPKNTAPRRLPGAPRQDLYAGAERATRSSAVHAPDRGSRVARATRGAGVRFAAGLERALDARARLEQVRARVVSHGRGHRERARATG